MPQSETSHAGLCSAPRDRWRGWLLCRTLASAASVSVKLPAGCHANAQFALDTVMQEAK